MSDKKFECDCLECSHKFTSEEHCVDTKCPKCGGKTRRAERPGTGKENRSDDGECVETAETTNSPPWGDIKKNKENFPKKTQFIIRSGENWSDWKLPYKLKNGKIHCGGVAAASQAAGGARQRKPMSLTSTERARLNRARSACKTGEPKTSEEMTINMSMGKLIDIEMVEKGEDEGGVFETRKFELMDNAKTYNGLHFPGDALQHQNEVFQEKEFTVSHGKNHSHKLEDQLGQVVGMELQDEGNDIYRCFIISKFYYETDAQLEAKILMKQGLCNYISGGWSARIVFNEEEGRFEISNPVLREVSSTPVPAKTDADIQDVLNSLQSQHQTPLEEIDMTEENQEQQEPSQPEGKEEQSAKPDTALNERQDSIEQEFAELKANAIAQERTGLLERAAELGLAETEFEGQPNAAIEFALQVANKVKMSTLRESDPDIPLGGDGAAIEDDGPEMKEYLSKHIYRSDIMRD